MLYAEDLYGTDMMAYRDHFPAMRQEMHGKPLAYLDSAASAQKPHVVLDAVRDAMNLQYANIHRGLYDFSQVKTKEFEAVRGKVQRFINAPSEQEVIFTRNATEAINLVAVCWAREFLGAGDELILTEMEHHANLVPWQMAAEVAGFTIKYIPVLESGDLDLEAFERLLTPDTKFLALTQISNALGTVNDVKKIIGIAKDFYPEMKVLVDGSQGIVHGAVDVQDLNCDFYAFTGHKLYGPTGVGVLWGRSDMLAAMPPYQGGGDMIETVSLYDVTYKPAPGKFEAGTPAIAEVIGLGAAIDYLNGLDFNKVVSHEAELLAYAEEKIGAIEGIALRGAKAAKRAGILSFTASWGHTSDIGMILDQCGVAVRTGHHCCMPLMEKLGVDSTVRMSLGLYSQKFDIDALARGLEKARDMLS